MKITKYVDINEEVEVEIHLDKDDLIPELRKQTADELKRSLNDMATWLQSVPDEKIAEIDPRARGIIGNFFAAQAGKYIKHNLDDVSFKENAIASEKAHSLQGVLLMIEWRGSTERQHGGRAPSCIFCGGIKPGEDLGFVKDAIGHKERCPFKEVIDKYDLL